MILAFDSHYIDNKAQTVCLAFENWDAEAPIQIFKEVLTGIAAYEPGSFYKRELPCILSLLATIPYENISYILVDGFVILDNNEKLGLGGHLYERLNQEIPIIGIAKSSFHQNEKHVKSIYRGMSKKPLFISALGIELNEAQAFIKNMHGSFRMPTLLQILDTNTKDWK